MIELNIQTDEIAEAQTSRSISLKIVVLGIAVSFLVHVAFLIWFAGVYDAFRSESKGDDSVTYEITLSTLEEEKVEDSVEPIPEEKPEATPSEPSPVSDVMPTASLPNPPIAEEVHNPIHNADEPGSRNNSEKRDGQLVAGNPLAGESNTAENLQNTTEDNSQNADDAQETDVAEALVEVTPKEELPEAEIKESVKTESPNIEPDPIEKSAPKLAVNNTNEDFKSEKKSVEEYKNDDKLVAKKPPEKAAVENIPSKSLAATTAKLEIPKEFMEKLGNIDLLDDSGLSTTRIEEPFSEIEARRIRLMNVYLEKMQKQVGQFWRRPAKEMPLAKGVIKFELDPDGYLTNAYIYRGSGNIDLDVSALDAVRSVARYAVPESRVVAARYYRYLSFHYSSRDSNVEEAPWEASKSP